MMVLKHMFLKEVVNVPHWENPGNFQGQKPGLVEYVSAHL